MRFLHTADWHIGKKLKNIVRIAEQRAVLQEIVDICDREEVEVLLIAGDIYDVATPSAEVVDLLHSTAMQLVQKGRLVLFISGNHDDPVRLANATIFSEKDGIYFYGNMTHRHLEQPNRNGIKILQANPYNMIVANDKEEVYIQILPYPSETRFREERKEQESFLQKIERWIVQGEQKGDLPSIFVSHLFVAGGIVGDEERELGSAKLVPLELLPKTDYVALGHIHKRQRFGENIRYSGSIMQYSFDDTAREKTVTIFDLNQEKRVHNLKEIPLQKSYPLKRIEAFGVEAAIELLQKYQDYYIELILYINEPLKSGQIDRLHQEHARLVTIQPMIQQKRDMRIYPTMHNSKLLPSELFKEFYKSEYGDEASEKLVNLFIEFMEKCNET